MTTNSVRNTKALANAVCAVCNSLPATMVVSRPVALIRCQFLPWCSLLAICAAKAPSASGRNSIESRSVDWDHVISQVMPWASNWLR